MIRFNGIGKCAIAKRHPVRPQATRNVWRTYADGSTYTLVNNRVVHKVENGHSEYWHVPVLKIDRSIKFN